MTDPSARKLFDLKSASEDATSFDSDRMREECGIFGAIGFDKNDAAALTVLGLHALQHRGTEACGIVSFDGEMFHAHRGLGLVDENFSTTNTDIVENLHGGAAVGHTRYSTSGDNEVRNIQPIYADVRFGGIALAHNGNITNSRSLREALVNEGALFQSTMDTEVMIHLMTRCASPHNDTSKMESSIDRLRHALLQVKGAWSVLALTPEALIGCRDPHGFRPLVLGSLGGGWILASESCALDIIGAKLVRDIQPGEMVVLRPGQAPEFSRLAEPITPHACIFEYIYFSRPDSIINGRSVYESRVQIGAQLAREHPIDVDVVSPVPDSGVPAALGFARQSGLPFGFGIIRNHYVGRTFIKPTQQVRDLGVKRKHNANLGEVKGKSVALVDDSIVRGTTARKIIQMLLDAGATEVHMRIASPPVKWSCFYGIDTPQRSDLIANNQDKESLRKAIGASSLEFISAKGLNEAILKSSKPQTVPDGFCTACFSGDYPVEVDECEATSGGLLSLLSPVGSSGSLKKGS